MPHQLVAIQTLVDHPQTLLADEQGLGKTLEILASLEVTQSWPAVVIAPATALLNWRDEAVRWLPDRKVAVQGGGVGEKDKGVPVGEADIVIINYESFAKHAAELAQRHAKALVADEAQYLKGYDSARTKAVKAFRSEVSVPRVIAATGTPVMNRPEELLTLLTLLPSLLSSIGGFRYYAARYCRATYHNTGWSSWTDFSGAGHLEELAYRLRATGQFVRREKSAVLDTLQPKEYATSTVEITNRIEYTAAENDLREWLRKHAKESASKREKKSDPDEYLASLAGEEYDFDLSGDLGDEALRRITVLRRLTGVGKIQAAVQQMRDAVARDGKLVVFAYHIEVQQAIMEAAVAAGFTPLSITGAQKAGARHAAIEKFQTNHDAKLIVCSITAAQTAINLFAADQALFVELDWSPAKLSQAEGRLHRIGQDSQVAITRLLAKDTLDQRMSEILDRKTGIIQAITSGTSAAVPAPYGLKSDGTPREQLPGTGRTPLSEGTRRKNRKCSQALWAALHLDYMRAYMRKYRETRKEAAATTESQPQP